MREISILPVKEDKKDETENTIKALAASFEKSLVSAVKEIKPPPVSVDPIITVPEAKKLKQSYLITINRDGHGRPQSMVVSPYEPS